MTPGSGRARSPRGGARGRRATLAPHASARRRPTFVCYLLLPLFGAALGASEDRRAPLPRLTPASDTLREAGERRRRTRAGAADNEARAERCCASGAGRRARGRVCYVCACQSTLTGRSPLARLRSRHRPLPPPIGRFEHKGPGSPRPLRGARGPAHPARSPLVGGADAGRRLAAGTWPAWLQTSEPALSTASGRHSTHGLREGPRKWGTGEVLDPRLKPSWTGSTVVLALSGVSTNHY